MRVLARAHDARLHEEIRDLKDTVAGLEAEAARYAEILRLVPEPVRRDIMRQILGRT